MVLELTTAILKCYIVSFARSSNPNRSAHQRVQTPMHGAEVV